MKKYEQKIDLVIGLKVSLDLIIKRIAGRLVCSKCGNTFNEFFNPPSNLTCCKDGALKRRSDDNVETAKKRYEIYENLQISKSL